MISSCNSQDCSNIPSSFKSYDEAVTEVKGSSFQIEDQVNTSQSSWIRGASYYSCNGEKGYLILKTDDEEYIHQDVPIEIWRGFPNASSFGSYYVGSIKGRYSLRLE